MEEGGEGMWRTRAHERTRSSLGSRAPLERVLVSSEVDDDDGFADDARKTPGARMNGAIFARRGLRVGTSEHACLERLGAGDAHSRPDDASVRRSNPGSLHPSSSTHERVPGVRLWLGAEHLGQLLAEVNVIRIAT